MLEGCNRDWAVQHGSTRGRFRKTRERRAGRSSDGHSGAAPPPVRSCRGLHSHLLGQRGPNASRPLSDAWIAGRTQRRGKCLQAHLRQPIQNGGMPLVKSGRQRPARHKMLPRKHPLARLPRIKGLSHRSRITKENGMHPTSSAAKNREDWLVRRMGNALSVALSRTT